MPTSTRGVSYRKELRELISRLGGEPEFIERENFDAGHAYLVSVIESVRDEALQEGRLERSHYGF